jgi:hypothetical protein
VTVPSSITGRKESCWARLKRWISSTKSSVPCPGLRRSAGRLEHLLQVGDAGEDRRDLLEMQVGLAASSRATVVLPVPGGPQKTSEPSEPEASMRVSAPSGPSR